MKAVAGALFGAFIGLFVAKEFTDRALIVLPSAMLGSMLGIILGVMVTRRSEAPPD